jgi:hypothetical protein
VVDYADVFLLCFGGNHMECHSALSKTTHISVLWCEQPHGKPRCNISNQAGLHSVMLSTPHPTLQDTAGNHKWTTIRNPTLRYQQQCRIPLCYVDGYTESFSKNWATTCGQPHAILIGDVSNHRPSEIPMWIPLSACNHSESSSAKWTNGLDLNPAPRVRFPTENPDKIVTGHWHMIVLLWIFPSSVNHIRALVCTVRTYIQYRFFRIYQYI